MRRKGDTFLVLSAEWMSNIILMNGLSVVYYSIKKELLQKLPLCLRRLFFRHPEKMKMFLEENPSRLFDVENDYYLPEEAYQDKRAFDCWAECLYEEFQRF